jgi:hypothetical protein
MLGYASDHKDWIGSKRDVSRSQRPNANGDVEIKGQHWGR